MRKSKEIIVVLWGEEEIQNYYVYGKWTPEGVRKILANTEVFEFDTYEEAEAFRQGMAAVVSKTARDFMELPLKGYKYLQEVAKVKAKIA